MKQNSAEQPYEAYERLKKELEEVNRYLNAISQREELKLSKNESINMFSFEIKLISKRLFWFDKVQEVKIPECLIPSLIESAESKKQQIENELNKLVNGQ